LTKSHEYNLLEGRRLECIRALVGIYVTYEKQIDVLLFSTPSDYCFKIGFLKTMKNHTQDLNFE